MRYGAPLFTVNATPIWKRSPGDVAEQVEAVAVVVIGTSTFAREVPVVGRETVDRADAPLQGH